MEERIIAEIFHSLDDTVLHIFQDFSQYGEIAPQLGTRECPDMGERKVETGPLQVENLGLRGIQLEVGLRGHPVTPGPQEGDDLVSRRGEGGGGVALVGETQSFLFKLLLQRGRVDQEIREKVAGRGWKRQTNLA